MTAVEEFPLRACADEVLAGGGDGCVGLVTRMNFAAWHADRECPYAFFDAKKVRDMPRTRLPGLLLHCCACGEKESSRLRIDWLVLHDAKRRGCAQARSEYGLAFFHCVGCRDAAHFAAYGMTESLFERQHSPSSLSATALHVTYEALCAARHGESSLFRRNYLTVLRAHPYTVTGADFVERDIAWSDLRIEHARCASLQCTVAPQRRAALEFNTFSAVYNEQGDQIKFTMAVCADSAACSDAIRADIVNCLLAAMGPGMKEVSSVPLDGTLPTINERRCSACGVTEKLRRCNGCKAVRYCSLACQRSDWSQHKRACRAVQSVVARERALAAS
jgi:hypothetical protein